MSTTKTPLRIRKIIDYEVMGLEEKIKIARKASPKSVTDLASEAGMSVANWYRIESGKLEFLPETTLKAMEEALGITLVEKP
jgi:ribosome-binding protein aMBF1 (putative translation factor)